MSNYFDIDQLKNGTFGVSKRFISAFSKESLGLLPVNIFNEFPSISIDGNIPDILKYRSLAHRRGEWIEAATILQDVRLSGRFKAPLFDAAKRGIVGSAINLTVGTLEALETSTSEPNLMFDNAFLVGGRGGAVYGHWLLDFIPQLITATRVSNLYGMDFPIIVSNCPAFGRRLIDFLGLQDRCVFPNLTDNLHVNRLVLPLITKHGTRYSTCVLESCFDRLLQGDFKEKGWRRLLVGRRKPPFVTNFSDLIDKLSPLGFEVVFPEDLTLSEQFRLFASANIVVGEDGSALHNAGFCSPGGRLIVYSRGTKVNYWHASVAAAAKLSLTYLQSDMDSGEHKAPIEAVLSALAK